jgi:hypothetical protein
MGTKNATPETLLSTQDSVSIQLPTPGMTYHETRFRKTLLKVTHALRTINWNCTLLSFRSKTVYKFQDFCGISYTYYTVLLPFHKTRNSIRLAQFYEENVQARKTKTLKYASIIFLYSNWYENLCKCTWKSVPAMSETKTEPWKCE